MTRRERTAAPAGPGPAEPEIVPGGRAGEPGLLSRGPRPVPGGWWFDVLLVALFVGITLAVLLWPPVVRWDLTVYHFVRSHRPPPVYWTMLVFDHLGQGGPVMTFVLVVGFWLAWRRRSVRPIMPAGLAPILTTASIVPLKIYTERGAPGYNPHLFSGPGNTEYPSGHVNNGIVYFGTLALLFAPYLSPVLRRLLQWLPGVLVAIGTTYMNYHWFSDSVAGFVLGVFLIRITLRIPWDRIPLPAFLDRGRAPTR